MKNLIKSILFYTLLAIFIFTIFSLNYIFSQDDKKLRIGVVDFDVSGVSDAYVSSVLPKSVVYYLAKDEKYVPSYHPKYDFTNYKAAFSVSNNDIINFTNRYNLDVAMLGNILIADIKENYNYISTPFGGVKIKNVDVNIAGDIYIYNGFDGNLVYSFRAEGNASESNVGAWGWYGWNYIDINNPSFWKSVVGKAVTKFCEKIHNEINQKYDTLLTFKQKKSQQKDSTNLSSSNQGNQVAKDNSTQDYQSTNQSNNQNNLDNLEKFEKENNISKKIVYKSNFQNYNVGTNNLPLIIEINKGNKLPTIVMFNGQKYLDITETGFIVDKNISDNRYIKLNFIADDESTVRTLTVVVDGKFESLTKGISEIKYGNSRLSQALIIWSDFYMFAKVPLKVFVRTKDYDHWIIGPERGDNKILYSFNMNDLLSKNNPNQEIEMHIYKYKTIEGTKLFIKVINLFNNKFYTLKIDINPEYEKMINGGNVAIASSGGQKFLLKSLEVYELKILNTNSFRAWLQNNCDKFYTITKEIIVSSNNNKNNKKNKTNKNNKITQEINIFEFKANKLFDENNNLKLFGKEVIKNVILELKNQKKDKIELYILDDNLFDYIKLAFEELSSEFNYPVNLERINKLPNENIKINNDSLYFVFYY